jgi:hypothetical protein
MDRLRERKRKRDAEEQALELQRQQEQQLAQRNQQIMSLIGQIQQKQDPAKAGVEGLPEFANITGMDTESLQAVADLAGVLYPDASAPKEPKIVNVQIGDKNVPHIWDAEASAFKPAPLTTGKEAGGPKFASKDKTTQAKKEADLKRTRLSNLVTGYKINMNSIFNRLRMQLAPEEIEKVENAFGSEDRELSAMLAATMVGAVQKAALPLEAKQMLLNKINDVNSTFVPLINDIINVDMPVEEEEKKPTQEPKPATGEEAGEDDNDGIVVGSKFYTTDGKIYDIVDGTVFIDGQRYRVKE